MLKGDSREEGDSGWSILSGYESDDYVNDPNNFQIISIGVILNIDDTILKFIEETLYVHMKETMKVDSIKLKTMIGMHI